MGDEELVVESIDLTAEVQDSGGGTASLQFQTKDLEPGRDYVRAALALSLTALLAVMVVVALVIAAGADSKAAVAPLKEILELTFTPVVGLVGSATGFYFGARVGESRGR